MKELLRQKCLTLCSQYTEEDFPKLLTVESILQFSYRTETYESPGCQRLSREQTKALINTSISQITKSFIGIRIMAR